MNTLLMCLTLSLASVLPTRAQEAPDDAPIPVGDLVVALIPYSDEVSIDAIDPLLQLYQREIEVCQVNGATAEAWNITQSNDGWLVIDTQPQVETIKAAVSKLIASLTRAPSQAPPADLVLETYVPRFVEAARLYQLLKPLQRTVWDAPAPGRGQREGRANVTFQESPSLLVLQDTAEQVARMRALLAQVDRPAPQMLLTCWLVSESVTGAAPGAALPPELGENLRRLLPWSQPSVLTTAMLRMSVVAGDERRLQGIYDAGDQGREEFQLVFKPAGVDESGRQLALQRIQFESSAGQGFDTSAVLTVGEYTVLGVAGDRPLLVALRATPLER